MNARIVAAVILRLAGAWLVLRAVYGFAVLLWMIHSVSPRARISWWSGVLTRADSDTYLHDTYYVVAHRPIPMMLSFVLGLIFIFAAKPLARVLVWKLGEVS